MQTRSRIFDDLAKVAGGAVSTLSGIRAEIEVLVRQQIERFLVEVDMVPRDEFDAVKTMAANARAEQEVLAKRVQALEKKLGLKTPRKAGAKKPAPKKAKPQANPQAKRKAKRKTAGKA